MIGGSHTTRSIYWRQHRHLLLAVALLPIFVSVYYLSFWLRFEGEALAGAMGCFQATVGWIVLTKLAWFVASGACKGWSRIATFFDLMVLIRAACGSLLTTIFIQFLLKPYPAIPRSIFLLDCGATVVLLGGARCFIRGIHEFRRPLFLNGNMKRVLIVGAGDRGASVLRAIQRLGRPTYAIVGFLDERMELKGTRIEGLPVLGDCQNIKRVVQRFGIKEILVLQGELDGRRLRRLIEELEDSGCEVRVLPDYGQLLEGRLTVQPRAVSIEDLLRRPPVRLDDEGVRSWLEKRTILVTGSAGSIGSEICRQLLRFSPRRVVMLDRSETGQFFLQQELATNGNTEIDICIADVLDEPRMRRILLRERPEVIFHAAAYKHVPLMEKHPQEAVRNIVSATRLLADMATEFQCESFVMISTDKAVKPTSIMGACKRAAEIYVQTLAAHAACRFITVRFGNVLDSSGSVVQLFRQQIAAGGPLTVTHPEMQRFFMTIPEAAQLVIQAGAIGRSGQILVLDMGEPVRILDLARDMIRLSGLRVEEDVAIQFIGLRPGEKLYEELYTDEERRLPTPHPKIIVAEHKPYPAAAVHQAVERLELLARSAPEEIPACLRELVQDYTPGGESAEAFRFAA